MVSDHLTPTYNDIESSWGLMYNLYPDKWLGLNLVDESVRHGFLESLFGRIFICVFCRSMRCSRTTILNWALIVSVLLFRETLLFADCDYIDKYGLGYDSIVPSRAKSRE